MPFSRERARATNGVRTRQGSIADHGGFTVMEVMAAVVILSIALLSLLRANNQTLLLKSHAQNITTATLLTQEKLAEVRINPGEIEESAEGDFGDSFPYWRWTLTNEEVEIPFDFAMLEEESSVEGGERKAASPRESDELPTIQEVTFTIFWPEGNKEGNLKITEYFTVIEASEEAGASEPSTSQLSSPATSAQGTPPVQ